MDKQEEARLRELIRKELENRTAIKASEAPRDGVRTSGLSEERQRIIADEIREFHRRRGGAQEYVNEEGNVEWLTEEEIVERDKQLPVDMEELEVGQRDVRNRIVLLSVLLFAGLALMFVSLREETGSVQVICNVPRATIHLDGSPTEYLTDFTLKGLPAGAHLISVSKTGYVAYGERSARIDLSEDEQEVVVLRLEPKSPRWIHG
jgi:hypothetical protein